MTHTISSTYNSLITVSGTTDNPTTITAAGLLGAGLYADSFGAAWLIANAGSVLGSGITLASAGTVTNAGSIASNTTSPSGQGILLSAGGSVTNQSDGTISGKIGIQVSVAAGMVSNSGGIIGTSTVGDGILLQAGGSISNESSGAITGYVGINAANSSAAVVN